MAIVISGVNNNDKITATDGTIDLLSGVNYTGILTAPAFTASGNITAASINVGNNIQLGNAGVATATTFVGNLTGNVNATSNLLLQIGGSEKFRVASSGQLGIGGANYGTSGQVLTSGGSGSAATWSTINSDAISEGNTKAEVVDTGSDGHFKVETEGNERLRITSDGRVVINKTSGDYDGALHVNAISENAITIEGTNAAINWRYQNGSAGYRGGIKWHQNGLVKFDAGIAGNTYYYAFHLNAAERLRIDSSGRLIQRYSAAPYDNRAATFQSPAGQAQTYIAVVNTETNGQCGILFGDHAGQNAGNYDGYINYSHQYQHMSFLVNGGNEKVRITSGGQLQIMNSGSAKISIYHDSSGLNHITSNSGQEFKVSSGNGDSNGIEFWDYTGTNKRCQIDGHGIKFNADTAQANALDDYEEGSWTPSIISGASGISVSTATYTKVGRLVHVQCRYNSLSSPNGSQLKIGGLPYSSASTGHYTTAVMHDGWDFGGSQEPVPTVYMSGGNPHFVFYYSRTAGQGWASVSGSDTNGAGAIFSWCYHSA